MEAAYLARLYAVEDRVRGLTGEERLELRKRLSGPVVENLNRYLLKIRNEVLPKSPAARAPSGCGSMATSGPNGSWRKRGSPIKPWTTDSAP
jgi:Transposase IS66 family